MKRILALLTFVLMFTALNSSILSAFDNSTRILGKWKVNKIEREGKAIGKKDPMAAFTSIELEFLEGNKIIAGSGKSKMQGVWKLENNKLTFLGFKYGLDVNFKDDDNLMVHYQEKNVKIYLKRQ